MNLRMTPHPHHSTPVAAPPANCFTVLIIDDLAANRLLLRKFLESAGYAVIEAANGVEALDLLRARQIQPDLVVTDIEMPVMDGITLVEQIRVLDSGVATVPIVTASGNADEEMRKQSLAAGSDIFLTKPFDLKQLRREIGGLLRSRRKVSRANFNVTSMPEPLSRLDTEAGAEAGQQG